MQISTFFYNFYNTCTKTNDHVFVSHYDKESVHEMKPWKKVVSLLMLVSSKGLIYQKLLMEGINVKHPNFKKQ